MRLTLYNRKLRPKIAPGYLFTHSLKFISSYGIMGMWK